MSKVFEKEKLNPTYLSRTKKTVVFRLLFFNTEICNYSINNIQNIRGVNVIFIRE
jgi:hypothetical protein